MSVKDIIEEMRRHIESGNKVSAIRISARTKTVRALLKPGRGKPLELLGVPVICVGSKRWRSEQPTTEYVP